MIVTDDPAEIAAWLPRLAADGMFKPGHMLDRCYRGECTVHRLVVVPGVAMAAIHGHGKPDGRKASYFTVPGRRREGYARLLQAALLGREPYPLTTEKIARDWPAPDLGPSPP